jgi:hypothetical protein
MLGRPGAELSHERQRHERGRPALSGTRPRLRRVRRRRARRASAVAYRRPPRPRRAGRVRRGEGLAEAPRLAGTYPFPSLQCPPCSWCDMVGWSLWRLPFPDKFRRICFMLKSLSLRFTLPGAYLSSKNSRSRFLHSILR